MLPLMSELEGEAGAVPGTKARCCGVVTADEPLRTMIDDAHDPVVCDGMCVLWSADRPDPV